MPINAREESTSDGHAAAELLLDSDHHKPFAVIYDSDEADDVVGLGALESAVDGSWPLPPWPTAGGEFSTKTWNPCSDVDHRERLNRYFRIGGFFARL